MRQGPGSQKPPPSERVSASSAVLPILTPMRAIRALCVSCSGDSIKEVRLCQIYGCPLWPYRMGRRPGSVKQKWLVNQELHREVAREAISKELGLGTESDHDLPDTADR